MIIIPTYNSGKFLLPTVRSALSQTSPCRVIVIDNGSSDNSTLGLPNKSEVVRFGSSISRIDNWNRCLDFATTEDAPFLKILFAGDTLQPSANLRYLEAFDQSGLQFVTSRYYHQSAKTRILPGLKSSGRMSVAQVIQESVLHGNWFNSPSVYTMRKPIYKNLKFSPAQPWSADWQFALSAALLEGTFLIDEPLVTFNECARNHYSSSRSKLESYLEEIQVLESLLRKADDFDLNRADLESVVFARYAKRFGKQMTVKGFLREWKLHGF